MLTPMTRDEAWARHRFGEARVAHLATADAEGTPHVVPITLALDGDIVWTAIDHKPKTTWRLRRLTNLVGRPRCAILVDSYDDDWTQLWWVRADADAQIFEDGHPDHRRGVERLAARYPEYRVRPPSGPAVAFAVRRWSWWSAGGIS